MSQLNDFPQTSLEGLLVAVEQAWEQGRGYECVSRLCEEHPTHADDLLDFLEGLVSIELGSTPDSAAAERSAADVAERLEAAGEHSLADAIRRSAGLPVPATTAPLDASLFGSSGTPPAPFASAGMTEQPPEEAKVVPGSEECTIHPLPAPMPSSAVTSYPTYAVERLGMTPPEVASGHSVPMRFLQQIDKHPRQTPLGAQEEIARRGAVLGLDYEEALNVLCADPDPQVYAAVAASSDAPLRSPKPFSYRDLVDRSFRNDPEARAFWLSFADGSPPARAPS